MPPDAPEKMNGEDPGEVAEEVAGAVAEQERELGEVAASVVAEEEPGSTMATEEEGLVTDTKLEDIIHSLY